ncbi:MAG: hypothetical protein MUC95_06485 [Spirochaetes bacterium]|jgi:hypothetical protein|nr:hypothetical protein [Spirochaetota bacterium]
MDIEKATGYEDQEMLIKAFMGYLSNKIDRSEHILQGLIRQSIHDGAIKHNTTLKELRYLGEDKRLQIFLEMVDIFLDKISNTVGSRFQRDGLKKDGIQIYSQWKKKKRIDPLKNLLAEMEKMMELDED